MDLELIYTQMGRNMKDGLKTTWEMVMVYFSGPMIKDMKDRGKMDNKMAGALSPQNQAILNRGSGMRAKKCIFQNKKL